MSTDNDLIRLVISIINAGLTARGYSGVIVAQSNQPTQQGVNSGSTVFLFKLFDHRYGFPARSDVWDVDSQTMIHTEIQIYETTFQISSLVRQNPATPSQYTASDLVNEVASIMQSDQTVNLLNVANVGIFRVTEVRNPYFKDDRDQFEASPSFDFVLTHRQTRVSTNPVVESINPGIYRV
jgi:hypothetical protein